MGMAKIFLVFFIVLSFSSAKAKIIVISDLDETIKHTTVGGGSTWGTVRRAIFGKKVYLGMPELFQSLKHYVDRQYVLTGSPSVIRRSMWKLFRYNNIPVDYLITNRWAPMVKTYKYKYKKLSKIFNFYKKDQFILIGDNTGDDAKVYLEMKEKFPEQVLGIYIHNVKNQAIPSGATPFFSAFEIAYFEHLAGRMEFRLVENVYNKILNQPKLADLFPKNAKCPDEEKDFSHLNDPELSELITNLKSKIINYCKGVKVLAHPLNIDLAQSIP